MVRYGVRAKAVGLGVMVCGRWLGAGHGLGTSYVFIHLCCDCGDGGGVVVFWSSGFSPNDDAFGGKSGGLGKGLNSMRVVQCELLEGVRGWWLERGFG